MRSTATTALHCATVYDAGTKQKRLLGAPPMLNLEDDDDATEHTPH
jgi:hypothetical protein